MLGAAGFAAVLFVLHAWHFRFLQDDAYIFLRYARNFAEGHGLVWNVGEPVEGYTSFLWVLILGGIHSLFTEVIVPVHILTVSLGLGVLGLTFSVASRLAGTYLAGCLAILLLAADRNFAVWSTSGMDTRLFGFLTLLAAVVSWRLWEGTRGRKHALALGGCLILLSWSRPEGIVLSAVIIGYLIVWARNRTADVVVAGSVWLAGVAIHFLGRKLTYGEWLPNTFYAKVTGIELPTGLAYYLDFLRSYPVMAVLGMALLGWAVKEIRRGGFMVLAGMIVLVQGVYLAMIGGDFMEFRMLDVLLPFVSILFGMVVVRLTTRSLRYIPTYAILGLALLVIIWHGGMGVRFEQARHKVLTWTQMTKLTTDVWVAIGKWFGKIAHEDESIATGSCGAIPYFSRLRCLDMTGLNDKFVARQPPLSGRPAGHRKVAPSEYVRSKNITFIVFPTRVFPLDSQPPPGQDDFLAEVENADPGVFDGRNFLLYMQTPGDKSALIESLRRRNVRVVDS